MGVYFGPAGEEVDDPYFGGEGPRRTGCVRCGQCMVGCRYGAKNTLRKNYLWFAEKLGVKIQSERTVIDITPLGPGDGSEGYEITTERSGAWLRKQRSTVRTRSLVLAAGALGTNKLLRDCKQRGSLPRISDRLGELVRTNSESVMAVTAPDDSRDFSDSVAITSSIYPDPNTHVEVVTYGKRADSMSILFTLMTGDGTRLTRPVMWLGQAVRHPLQAAAHLLAVSLVAADGDPADHAVARQRDPAGAQAQAAGRRPAPDRAGPRAAQPDLYPGRGTGRRTGSRSRWTASRRAASPSRSSTSPRPPTSSAAR